MLLEITYHVHTTKIVQKGRRRTKSTVPPKG
jgi:hypothetical protein